MFQVNTDMTRNRLYIQASGRLTVDELTSAVAEVKQSIPKLRRGWVAAVDLRGMQVLEQSLTGYLKEIQEIIMQSGAERIGTILDAVILKMQLSRLSNQTGSVGKTERFDDPVAWEAYLAGK